MSRNFPETLIGNASIKTRLSAGHLSHAYIISGPKGSGRHTLAAALCQAYVCSAPAEERPCGTCLHCRKAAAGIHPDIIFVSSVMEDGKRLSPGRAREYHRDACIAPNEANRKVYLFDRADDLSAAVQNVLLKLIEEGPEYAAFLLITEHSGQLLPTVQSRCEELKLTPVSREEILAFLSRNYPDQDPSLLQAAAEQCGGIPGRAIEFLTSGEQQSDAGGPAAEFCTALAKKNEAGLAAFMAQYEKCSREELTSILQQCRDLLHKALLLSCDRQPQSIEPVCFDLSELPASALLAADDCLREAVARLEGNAGVGHLLGWLAVSCTEIINPQPIWRINQK